MSNIKFLDEEEIFKQLKYLGEICDTTVDHENPHELSYYIEKLTSVFANASYVWGSAVKNYQTKKTPDSIALRDWTKELCDKMDKRLSGIQTCTNVARSEKEKSRFQGS